MDTAAVMTFARALEITNRINDRALLAMGIVESPVLPTLERVTLAEMVEAVAIVRHHNKTAQPVDGSRLVHVVPADRLIAAVYVGLHYAVDDARPISIEPFKDEFGQWQMKAVAVVELTTKTELRGVEAA